MKVRHKLVSCFFTLLLAASLATNAQASCPGFTPGPPCMEFARADAVFIGVASRVVGVPNNTNLVIGPYLQSTVYFSVEEAFKGVETSAVVLEMEHCGHVFNEGERYLVYAHRNNKKLEVRARSTRTQLLSAAGEDLEYLRSLPSLEPGSRIYGQVAEYSISFKDRRYTPQLLPNIKVTFEGNGQTLEALTDSEGRYEFKGVPQGTYRLRAELPAHLSYDVHAINIPGRGCVPLDITARRRAEISGRVLDVNGKALVQVPISLALADQPLEEMLAEETQNDRVRVFTVTNQQGKFVFAHLPPGRYFLIINRAEYEKALGNESSRTIPRLFYPGVSDPAAATVIVVGKDDKTKTYDFHLLIN